MAGAQREAFEGFRAKLIAAHDRGELKKVQYVARVNGKTIGGNQARFVAKDKNGDTIEGLGTITLTLTATDAVASA